MGGMECERAFWNPIIFETGSSPVEFQSDKYFCNFTLYEITKILFYITNWFSSVPLNRRGSSFIIFFLPLFWTEL